MLRPNALFKTLNQPISLLTPRFSGNTTQTGWHTVQFKLCKEHLLMYVDWVHCTVSHTDNIIRNPFKQGGESPPQLLFHHPHTHTHKPIRRSKKSAVPTVCWLGGWQKCWRRGDGALWPSSSSSVLHCSWNDEPGCPDCAGTNVLTWWSQKWPVKRTNTQISVHVTQQFTFGTFTMKGKSPPCDALTVGSLWGFIIDSPVSPV